MMNEEQFEQKLAAELQQVTVPRDLQAKLLDLCRLPVDKSEPIPIASDVEWRLSDRKFAGWGRAWAAAVLVAGVAASLWLGWSYLELHRTPELAKQKPVGAPINENSQRQTRAEQLAEIEQLRVELRELERAYQELEKEELVGESINQVTERHPLQLGRNGELHKAEAVFWTAETSYFSGLKTDGVREQLLYVISEFPESDSAKRAQALLAEF